MELVKPVSRTPLETLVADYLDDCRARGLSPKTIRFSYGYPLQEVLLPWCAAEGITDVGSLTTRGLNRLSGHLQTDPGAAGRPLTKATVWTYMKAIKRFLAWAESEGERITAKANLPKLDRRLPDILEPSEVDRLEDTATTERDKLIIRVLASTGIRRAELAGLTTRDVVDQSGSHYLKVHGKGGKDRIVPIEPALYRRLRRFINGRPHDADSDRLFLGLARDHNGVWQPLSESGVTQMVTDLGRRSGIEKRITPHIFRHTAATVYLRGGVNPLLVAQFLGHSDLQMLNKVYSHLAPTDAHREMMLVLKAQRGD